MRKEIICAIHLMVVRDSHIDLCSEVYTLKPKPNTLSSNMKIINNNNSFGGRGEGGGGGAGGTSDLSFQV